MRRATSLHCVLVLCQMHSMACNFHCCEKVSHKEVCPAKMNTIFYHKNDHFSPSPSEYFLPTLPAGPLGGKELTTVMQLFPEFQSFLRNKLMPSTWQIMDSNNSSSLVVNKDILRVLPACYLFSAYQSDMEIYILQFFVNLNTRITKHFYKMLTSIPILNRNVLNRSLLFFYQ